MIGLEGEVFWVLFLLDLEKRWGGELVWLLGIAVLILVA